eukprot:7696513-Alexandrium_andersonii.AAC.1
MCIRDRGRLPGFMSDTGHRLPRNGCRFPLAAPGRARRWLRHALAARRAACPASARRAACPADAVGHCPLPAAPWPRRPG